LEKWTTLVMGPIIGLGPWGILGTTTPLLPSALPHPLGSVLVYLAFSLVLSDRLGLALISCFFSIIIHIQHGAQCLVILLPIVFLTEKRSPQKYLFLLVIALLSIMIYQIVHLRGLDVSSADIDRLCQLYIPHHCYSRTWNKLVFLSAIPFLYFSLEFLYFLIRKKVNYWGSLLFVAIPLLVVVFAVVMDYFNVPFFSQIVRRYFVLRFANYLYFFAGWGILLFLLQLRNIVYNLTIIHFVRLVFGLASIFIWLWGYNSSFQGNLFFSLFFLLLLILAFYSFSDVRKNDNKRRSQILVVVVILLPYLILYPQEWKIGRRSSLEIISEFGNTIKRLTPSGSIIISSPSFQWLRFYSRRALVADSTYLPFGGVMLNQWEERLRDLGGFSGEGFKLLSGERISQLAQKYQASYVLLSLDDPKMTYANIHWKQLIYSPHARLSYYKISN
ncbi:MAG: DUF6798 domain-containing protein, partial [Pseudomonadota bacterium]